MAQVSRVAELDGEPARRSAWSDRPLRTALVLVLAMAVVASFAAVAEAVHLDAGLLVPMTAFAGIGLADVAIGVLAWWRRPHNRTGPLLCVVGFSIILAVAGNSAVPVLNGLGFLVGQAPIATILHLLLAFPSGRLRTRAARALAASGYLVTVGIDAIRLWQKVTHHLQPGQGTPIYDTARLSQRILGAVILITASVYLLDRLRRSGPSHGPGPGPGVGVGGLARTAGERRALAAVYGWGIAILWFIPLSSNVIAPLLGWGEVTLFVAQIVSVLAMPVVFAVGLLRGGFARTGRIEELSAALATGRHGRGSLREAVADALGDPTATLALPVPTAPPTPGHNRVLVRGGDGAPVAAIDYDSTAIGDAQPVTAVAEVLSLALQREQLLAELLTHRQQLVDSRARIVQAADAERRRVVTDLHDVLQGRLVVAALRAGELAARTAAATASDGGAAPVDVHAAAEDIRRALDDALTELRHLIQGVMPATLTDAGLRPALAELLDRTPLTGTLVWQDQTPPAQTPAGDTAEPVVPDRLVPDPVAVTAYLIAAEAVTNAVKHSGASKLHLTVTLTREHLTLVVEDDGHGGAALDGARVSRGPDERRHRPRTGLGLRSIADRADALGGHLTLDSPPGQGTRLTVQLPLSDQPVSDLGHDGQVDAQADAQVDAPVDGEQAGRS